MHILIRYGPEIETFRKEKTDHVVGVFVRAALPRFVRFGKVDQCIQRFFYSKALDRKPTLCVMLAIETYDGMNHAYYVLGEKVGNAFHDGAALK